MKVNKKKLLSGKKQNRKKVWDEQMRQLMKQSRGRRTKMGSYSAAMTAVVIAGAVVVNLIVSEFPTQYTKLDFSGLQLSSLSDQTKELAAELTEDVTLYYIVQDSSRDSEVSRLLERYDDLSEHITVVEKDPVLYPKFTAQYTDETLSDNSVIAVSGGRSRVIPYGDMYESEFNYNYYTYETTGFDAEGQITSAIAALNVEELPKVYMLAGHNEVTLSDTMLASVGKENIETDTLSLLTEDAVPEDADCLLIAAPSTDLSSAEANKVLNYLRTGGKAIIFTEYTGQEMPNLNSILEYYGTTVADGIVMESNNNYYLQVPYYLVPEINSTDVSSDLSGGNGYVLLAAAQGLRKTEETRDGVQIKSVLTTSDSAYSKANVETMTTYAQEDGDIDGPFDLGVLITETVELTEELLEETSGTVEEESLGTIGGLEGLVLNEESESEAATASEEAEKSESEAVSVSEETESNQQDANSEMESELASEVTDVTDSEDETGESDTESKTEADSPAAPETAETKLAVFTSSVLLDESADQMVSGGNSRLFLNTLSWICGETTSVSVPVKSLTMSYLTVTASAGNFWSIMTIVLIPAAFLAYGLVIWLKRRKR